jgi:Spy/CpxP family protein refolding chaperone
MRRKSLLLAGAVFGILVLVFSLAYAEHPGRDRGEMADELGLTDEQMESMKDIRYNFRKAQIGLRAELKTARLELRHLMMEENPNQGQISKLVDKIADTQKELLKQRVDRKLAMKEILTAEQLKKFMRMRGEHRKGRMGMGDRRDDRRHRPRGLRSQGEGPGF